MAPAPFEPEPPAETRERLVDVLRGTPGLTQREAARALGLDYSTIQYHVRRLERERAVRLVPLGRVQRLYLPEDEPSAALRAKAALESPGARAVLELARARGGVTVRDIVDVLALPRSTAHERLARLARAGVLVPEDAGSAIVYRERRTGG